MQSIFSIPEIQCLTSPNSLVRLPDQMDIPVTPRISALIDSKEFQRLRRVSQLGLVNRVYPGATHTRFEHSLGVYRNALLFLQQLASAASFGELVSANDATSLILAALLHDIGHYPFCHPIEDLGIEQFQAHESLARNYLLDERSEVRRVIESEFEVSPESVVAIIEGEKSTAVQRILSSILSGPIDVDKFDYLYRDSHHAGVPYGRNFDAHRLVSSLCLNGDQSRLAITSKGRTAAEMLVFARYVMFSEVYWHHAVRSATAMLQRAVYELFVQSPVTDFRFDALYQLDDLQFGQQLMGLANNCGSASQVLLKGLFGSRRELYKRVASYSCLENETVYRAIARQPYPWLVACAAKLASQLSNELSTPVSEFDILIDAPPVGLEVQFDVEVYYADNKVYRPLGKVSPVVHTLAKQQFDDLVKQVRVFVAPRLVEELAAKQVPIDDLLLGIAGKC